MQLILQKNTALTIGADTLSAEAAALEEKLDKNDLFLLAADLPDFNLKLQAITERIRKALA